MFHIDVFASIWENEFAKLNDDFHAEIPVTAGHVAAESVSKAAAKKAELASMSAEEVRMKTESIKRSDRKAQRKHEQVDARAQASADELDSHDDKECDHRVKLNPVVITPRLSKTKTSDAPEGILAWHMTPTAGAAVLMTIEEAQKATDEVASEEDPTRKRVLLMEAL